MTVTINFTFQNGRKTRELMNMGGGVMNEFVYNYDSQGRRTTTIHTLYSSASVIGSRQFTRTYHADGTLQKVTYPVSFVDNTTVTKTFTWEDGKTTVNDDDFMQW
jgi:hypothetical protein